MNAPLARLRIARARFLAGSPVRQPGDTEPKSIERIAAHSLHDRDSSMTLVPVAELLWSPPSCAHRQAV